MRYAAVLSLMICFFAVALNSSEKGFSNEPIQNAQVVGTIHNTRGQWNPFLDDNNMECTAKKGEFEFVAHLSTEGGRNADGIYALRFYVNHDIDRCFRFTPSKTGKMTMVSNVDQSQNLVFRVKQTGDYHIHFNPTVSQFSITPEVETITEIKSMQINGFVYDKQGESERSNAKRTYPSEKWDETLASHQMDKNSDGTWSKKIRLVPNGGMHKDGIYQFLFTSNQVGDWGYSALNGQPNRLSGAGGYNSRPGRAVDSGIVIRVTAAGDYTIKVNPVHYWYTVSPETEHLNGMDKFQVNGYIVDDPWNPFAESHEMSKNNNGRWTKSVYLSAEGGPGKDGVYCMNFSIDNNWHQDSLGMGGIWGKTWHTLPQEYNIMFKVLRNGEYKITLDPTNNTYGISPKVLPITKIYSLQFMGNFPEFNIDGANGWNPYHKVHQMLSDDGIRYYYDLILKKDNAYSYKYAANNAGWYWGISDYPHDGYARLSLHGDPPSLNFTPETSGTYRFQADTNTGEYSIKPIIQADQPKQ